jgi:tetratricopeptide (TPR) repeat protein
MPPVTAVAVSEPPSSVDEPPPRPQPAAKPKKPEKPAESRRIAVANPPVSPPPAPKPSAPRDGDRSPTLSQRFIGGASAQQRLQDARVSARLGRLDDACDIYEQLLSSDQSWIACAEEAALLNRLGRPRDALTVTNALPSDQLPDAARIEQGKALMTLKRHSEALGGLSRVNGNGPHGRMALLLIARCLMAEGKTEFSGKVLKRLSLGKDDIAAAARGELGMASR